MLNKNRYWLAGQSRNLLLSQHISNFKPMCLDILLFNRLFICHTFLSSDELWTSATPTTIFGRFTKQKSRKHGKPVYFLVYNNCDNNSLWFTFFKGIRLIFKIKYYTISLQKKQWFKGGRLSHTNKLDIN